jgi:hypothetical protein
VRHEIRRAAAARRWNGADRSAFSFRRKTRIEAQELAMPSQMNRDDVRRSPQSAWPMVEIAIPRQEALRDPSSKIDEDAYRIGTSVEARTQLPRAANGEPPSLDRATARALVDAGYIPLADYVALYGHEIATAQEPRQAEEQEGLHVTGHFPVAFPRRQTYRATSVRWTFAKPPPRPDRGQRRA